MSTMVQMPVRVKPPPAESGEIKNPERNLPAGLLLSTVTVIFLYLLANLAYLYAFPAHVIATIPSADRSRATVRVRIGFDHLDPRILPEMAISVRFLSDDAAAR